MSTPSTGVPPLLDRLIEHIRSARLFPRRGTALLAVSGGPDSVALLDLFAMGSRDLGLDLAVGHVDHGIHPASDAVARQVATIAHEYGLPFRLATLHLGAAASETRARSARYRVLRSMQHDLGARYLVTAHHADDQAETVLLRLLKGSGPSGLAGIPARGPDGLVRPLLPFTRSELEAWLAERGIARGRALPTHGDPANADLRHDRSWLRQRLLPILRERFGSEVDRRLATAARLAGRDRRAWASLLFDLPELEFDVTPSGVVEVARSPLRRYDKTLSEALLRAVAREAGCMLGPTRAARLVRFVSRGSSGRVMQLGEGWEAELSFDRVRLHRLADRTTQGPAQATGDEDGRLGWGSWEFAWRTEPAGRPLRRGFDTWIPRGAFEVRAAGPGERIVPLGGPGRRTVRRLLMEARVPMRERAEYPVLVRSGRVVWVPGVCRGDVDVPSRGQAAFRVSARAARSRRRSSDDRASQG